MTLIGQLIDGNAQGGFCRGKKRERQIGMKVSAREINRERERDLAVLYALDIHVLEDTIESIAM